MSITSKLILLKWIAHGFGSELFVFYDANIILLEILKTMGETEGDV